MLLIEEEAKEKLCPHLSSNAFFNYTTTREYRLAERKCRASKCMGWRWASDDEYDGLEKKGFCGLAGRVTQ